MEIPGGRGYALQAPPGMKIPRGLGGGGMDIFWNYIMKKHNRGKQKLFSVIRYGTNVSISVYTTVIF